MKTQKTQYTEPTEPARPGDTVNFKYVENYDPKKYYRNVSGGLTRRHTQQDIERDMAFESMND